MQFSLIIPLWNEGNNVPSLIEAIAKSELIVSGMAELILVNNGSSDATGKLIEEGARNYSWIVPVHLDTNENYGGGVYEGCKWAKTDILCYIPGDLQVMPDDVVSVHNAFCANAAQKISCLLKVLEKSVMILCKPNLLVMSIHFWQI